MKKLTLIPIMLFILSLWTPAIQMHFQFYKEFEDAENRPLAEAPRLEDSGVSKLVKQCEAYVDDHFGFRPDLIRWNNLIRIHLFGVSPAQSVIVGDNSWLFYCAEAIDDGDTIDDFMGRIPLSDAELEDLKTKLEENNVRFAERGIKYVVAIAPDKSRIYSEHLPDMIKENRSRTRLEQFLEYMKEHSSMKVLDLSEPLLKNRSRLPVFWATDSHWNSFGAYIGYTEIMKRISECYPNMKAIELSGDTAVEQRPNGGDLAQILFIQDVWPESNNSILHLDLKRTPSQLEKLVFRHDSFGDALYPYLNKHFKKIIGVAPFVPFNFERIYKERPEIVLHLFTERYLAKAIHDDFFFKYPD